MTVLSNIGTVFAREMMPVLRMPLGLIFTMMLPLLLLALFGPLLTGMPGVGDGSPWQWFVPGMLVLLGLSGTAGAGAGLLTEMVSGSLERLLVTPLNRAAMLIGRTLKEVVTLLAQAVLIIVVLVPFGFELHPLGALVGLVILVIFGIGLGSLSFTLAIMSRKQETLFYGVQQVVFFPLMLLSGVLLPMDTAPSWLYGLSRINPVTYIVDAERALFAGDLGLLSVLWGMLAALAIAGLGLLVGTRAMRNVSV